MLHVSVQEIQRDPLAFIHRIEAGEPLLVVRGDVAIAEVQPVVRRAPQSRPLGLAAGEFLVPDDFDEPLPDDVIEFGLGKLPLPSPPAEYLPRQRAAHRIESLAIDEAVLLHLAGLPLLHRDPFDRMLIAQALEHGLTIASLDPAVRAYPAPCLY